MGQIKIQIQILPRPVKYDVCNINEEINDIL